ncbi:MAG: (d)CMP kinase [Clostridiales bacterium]|jgi:cytidylate kinase|nr:(d)CMP kinase [Clostridiales bacterium]
MLRVAIDGPGGAGKSTIAKLVAEKFNLDYVDTGAMYRAMALKALNSGVDLKDEDEVKKLSEVTKIDFDGRDIILDGKDVSSYIRTQEVSMAASSISQYPCIREKVNALNKHMAETKNLVMDGRDIGTNVIKDAEVKIFLTASAEERADRRFKQLEKSGVESDYSKILEEIKERDYMDINRTLNPLAQADDAILLDTSNMNINEVVNYISSIILKVKK